MKFKRDRDRYLDTWLLDEMTSIEQTLAKQQPSTSDDGYVFISF